jgi:hypothetical protein
MPTGLVSRPDPNNIGGEVLTHDDGFQRLDGTNIIDYVDVGSTGVIVRIDNFESLSNTGVRAGEETTKVMALTAGDQTANSFEVWVLMPSTNAWTRVQHIDEPASTEGTAGINGDATEADPIVVDSTASMPDSCTFPAGAPARDIGGAANISRPCWVFTNNYDPVYVFPARDANLTDYEELTDEFTEFRAVSCETFGDRVYFLNTFEDSARHPNRLRRTARGTADPTASLVGSGRIDLEEFSGQGLRCETLGDVLACYFQDGTAFIRETGVATAPNEVQVLDERRGLLGTHAVTSVGDNKHFGIFTDGWWLLDSSGRWTKVGVSEYGGAQVTKWIDAFYTTLDWDNAHRIQMGYDPVRNFIRISQPVRGTRDASGTPTFFRVWIYDVNADRVWIDTYGANPTCWANAVPIETTAETWATIDASEEKWSDSGLGSWAGQEATFGLRAEVLHGTDSGLVMRHDPDLITRDTSYPSFSFPTPALDYGRIRTLKTIERVGVEIVNASNTGNLTVTPKTGISTGGGKTVSMATSNPAGTSEVFDTWHGPAANHTSERIGFTVSGTGPVLIRSLEMDYIDEGLERIK